jgi:hypothetical protein
MLPCYIHKVTGWPHISKINKTRVQTSMPLMCVPSTSNPSTHHGLGQSQTGCSLLQICAHCPTPFACTTVHTYIRTASSACPESAATYTNADCMQPAVPAAHTIPHQLACTTVHTYTCTPLHTLLLCLSIHCTLHTMHTRTTPAA